MRRRALAVLVVSSFVAARASAGPLDTLQPGEWYQVPSSHMESVDPCPQRSCAYSAVEGQAGVINDWSGGAFDRSRDRLLIWGGGHGGYAGNELYAFDLGTLTWSRLTTPSDPVTPDVPYAPDGRPTSRHTYDYIQYVPAIDSFCSFGGAAFYQTGQTGTAHTDCYNFGTSAWELHPDDPAGGSNIGKFSTVHPATGHAWTHGCGGYTSLAEFDPVANTWVNHGGMWTESANSFSYYLTAAIEPARNLFVAIGAGAAFTWDLTDAGDVAAQPLTTTGDQAMVAANSPGFEWDPVSHLFVAWSGGVDIYTLDPSTWAWTHVAPAASNTVTPTAQNMNGTFGRFRYSPAHNVFVVVNSTSEDVYVYRLTSDGGVPPPTVQLVAAPDTVDAGESSTLTWSANGATACTASGGWTGAVATSGAQSVGPLLSTTTFQLTCTGPAGAGGSLATVTVRGDDAGTPVDGGGSGTDGGSAGDGGAPADGGTPSDDAGTGGGPDGGTGAGVSGTCGCGAEGAFPGAAGALVLALLSRRWRRPATR